MQLHHATLFVRDVAASLPFYVDGLGLEVLVDREFDGPWPDLFGVTAQRLRAVILGEKANPALGQVELCAFLDPIEPGPAPAVPPVTSTVVLSFLVDLAAVLPRLEAHGATDVRRGVLRNGSAIAAVRDPDGVLIELIDTGKA